MKCKTECDNCKHCIPSGDINCNNQKCICVCWKQGFGK